MYTYYFILIVPTCRLVKQVNTMRKKTNVNPKVKSFIRK